MIKLKDILSATNGMIIMIMAGGNLILGITASFQEFSKMDCIREAIYQNATENEFTNCIIKSGLFNVDNTTWIFAQFVLILISIIIVSIIEGKRKIKK